MLSTSLAMLNNNKVVMAITMIIVNMGSRYVLTDISPTHERILSHVVFKRLVVFCMFFVATRDIAVSVCLTAAFLFVFNVLLSESSQYCIVPLSLRATASMPIQSQFHNQPRDDAKERWLQMMMQEQQQQQQQQPPENVNDPATGSVIEIDSNFAPYEKDVSYSPAPVSPEVVSFEDVEKAEALLEKYQNTNAEEGNTFDGENDDESAVENKTHQEEGIQNPESVDDPVSYSGGGVLYDERENDNDITRSTTLAFVNFSSSEDRLLPTVTG
jgi:hypothetical protein